MPRAELTVDREAVFEQLQYTPHSPGQWDAHNNDARFRTACCGRRWGKSIWAGHEMTLQMFRPDSINWIVGPQYVLGEREFKVVWNDFRKLGILERCKKSYNIKQGDMRIYFPELNSLLLVVSAEKPQSLLGETMGLDHVIMSESARHSMVTWQQYIEPALVDKRGSADFPSCVVEDTLILTEDGFSRIGDISSNREVGTYSEYNKQVVGFNGSMEVATEFYVSPKTETRSVYTRTGNELEGTLNHPIWSMRPSGVSEWIKLQDLKVGDYIATRRNANIWGDDDDLSEFFLTSLMSKTRSEIHGPDFDFSEMTDDLAYLMGLILGDGYIDFQGGRVSITSNDPETVDFLMTKPHNLNFKDAGGYHYVAVSKRFTNFLKWYGFKNVKARQKTLPKRLLKASRNTFCEFLSGLFDADGGSHIKRGFVSYWTSSPVLAKEVKFVLTNLGIISSKMFSEVSPTEKVTSESEVWKLELNGRNALLFYDNIGFRLSRKQVNRDKLICLTDTSFRGSRNDVIPHQGHIIKLLRKSIKNKDGITRGVDYLESKEVVGYDKLNSVLEKAKDRNPDQNIFNHLSELCQDNYFWDRIERIEASENYTFDLVVPTTHAFITNGIISHNTPRGFNWFKGMFDLGQDPLFPDFKSWHFPSWTNPIIFPGGYDDEELVRIRDARSNQWFSQEYGAMFTAYEGLIYQDFSPTIHVKPINYQSQWENWLALDFGFKDPTICLDIMVNPSDQRVYVWREYVQTQKTASENALLIRNREQPPSYHFDSIAADPRGADQIATMQFILGSMRANAMGRSLGIEAIAGDLKIRDDGLPGIIIDPSCKNLLEEIQGYHAKPKNDGVNEKAGDFETEGPDHSLDAFRYFYNERFVIGGGDGLADMYNGYEMTEAGTFFKYGASGANFTSGEKVGWR